ncbi:MAG: SDR family oxidoreductase [Pseudomonadota bacterium]
MDLAFCTSSQSGIANARRLHHYALMETILITGANRGIGLQLTRHYLDNGHRVLATCRQPDNAEALTDLAHHAELTIHPLEVTDADSVAALCDKLANIRIDVLVNNAGIMGGDQQSRDDMDYAAWSEAFAVNTMAPFRLVTALLPNLMHAERPRAITISSQMGSLQRQSKGSYAYRSSKAAVNKVMQVMALELAADGIIVCPVHPGWVRTDMGGNNADISVAQSAAGIYQLISNLTPTDSGRFWTWEGQEHPW